ncbi:hypothetical protein TNCV_4692261 [Trichonephila clavipes]|nr:hypothetical protein TNCV_4692261 [Trichonephila clavipes]
MDENKHVEEDKDVEMCLEASSVSGVSQDKCLLGFLTQKLAEKEETKGMPEKYLHIIRYLFLNSLDESPFFVEATFFDELENIEFYGIHVVTNMLAFFIFHKEFEKILEKGDEIKTFSATDSDSDSDCETDSNSYCKTDSDSDCGTYSDCDTEYVQFLLSRCTLLCPVPTYSTFVLVVAFLTLAVIGDVDGLDCFNIMFLSEFCLSVLYRRKFWKIFQSAKDYEKLKKFCDEFRKHFKPTRSSMTELRTTSTGQNWRNFIRRSMEASGDSFPLEESEIEMFKYASSMSNNMKCKPEILQRIEKAFFSGERKRQMQSFCHLCKTKCHNYLIYVNSFISV